jgi:hypothetical protein
MAKVPLPERGQPIDVAYIAQITNAVNQLSDKLVTTGYNYSTISGRDLPTSDVRVVAASISVSSGSSQTANRTQTFEFPYGIDFASVPIATATILNNGETNAGDAATVVLTNVNAHRLSGLVKFQQTGNVTTNVNLIVVGIPNAPAGV